MAEGGGLFIVDLVVALLVTALVDVDWVIIQTRSLAQRPSMHNGIDEHKVHGCVDLVSRSVSIGSSAKYSAKVEVNSGDLLLEQEDVLSDEDLLPPKGDCLREEDLVLLQEDDLLPREGHVLLPKRKIFSF